MTKIVWGLFLSEKSACSSISSQKEPHSPGASSIFTWKCFCSVEICPLRGEKVLPELKALGGTPAPCSRKGISTVPTRRTGASAPGMQIFGNSGGKPRRAAAPWGGGACHLSTQHFLPHPHAVPSISGTIKTLLSS